MITKDDIRVILDKDSKELEVYMSIDEFENRRMMPAIIVDYQETTVQNGVYNHEYNIVYLVEDECEHLEEYINTLYTIVYSITNGKEFDLCRRFSSEHLNINARGAVASFSLNKPVNCSISVFC